MRAVKHFLLAGAVCANSVAATGQNMTGSTAPGVAKRPFVLIVPAAAGGSADRVARILAASMGLALEQTVQVRNLPAKGGTDALNMASLPSADEIRIGFATNTPVITGQLYPLGATYKVFEDFDWLGIVGTFPNAVVVATRDTATSLNDWVAKSRALNRPMRYGAGPVGSVGYLAGRHLSDVTSLPLVHQVIVNPDEGYTALQAGAIDVFFDGVPNALEETARSGGRVLAVTSAQRSRAFPDAGSFGELSTGADFSVFAALVVSRKENDAIRARLKSAWETVNRQQVAKAEIEKIGMSYLGLESDSAPRFVENEFLRHAKQMGRASKSPTP